MWTQWLDSCKPPWLLDMADASSFSSLTCWWQCQEHVRLSQTPSLCSACSALVVAWLSLAWGWTPSHWVRYLTTQRTVNMLWTQAGCKTSRKWLALCDSFFSSCGVDPHSCADSGGDSNRLLLHGGAVAPGSHRLLHPGLEVVNPGCVFALLRLLPLCMVRYKEVVCKTARFGIELIPRKYKASMANTKTDTNTC